MKKIKLTQGKIALIDDEDYELFSQDKWCVSKSENVYYAVRVITIEGQQKTILIHREIAARILRRSLRKNEEIHHINGDGLDNRRCNLKVVSRSQHMMSSKKRNGQYTSKYKGVSWCKRDKKWITQIRLNGKLMHIGYFKNELDAAKAYDKTAKELFGEFVKLNFEE